MKAIGAGVQFVVFVLGLFSGYLEAVAPVSDGSLKIVPGGVAAISALVLLLLGRAISRSAISAARTRRLYWLALAAAASLIVVWSVLHYADLWQRNTVEVPLGFNGDEAEYGRRVKGSELTSRARAYIAAKRLEDVDDQELISACGGIPAVWTAKSIQDEWLRLTRIYVLSVVGTILALSFLTQSLSPANSASRSSRKKPRKPSPAKVA